MGAQEVHILFDKPNTMEFDPKVFERTRRDNDKSKSTHKHTAFSPTTPTPQFWHEYIECRECKRSIVEAIGLSLLQIEERKCVAHWYTHHHHHDI